MRIVHISDTHLGFSAYSKVDEESGLNQREVDFYQAFERMVSKCLELGPDAVLHTGDLFDTVRPTNRAISFALEQLLRLSEAEIPVVVIAGNHSTPKLRETGSVFKIFEHLEHIHPIYREEYEIVKLGNLVVHALPHCEGERLASEASRMEPEKGKRNVAMLHAGISSLQVFRMGEFNEEILPASYLKPEFDYIALGHYHDSAEVTPNACYAGSSERLSFTEAGAPKGMIEVDLDKGRRRFIEMPSRPMLDLGAIDARDLDLESLRSSLQERIQARDIEGKIVRVTVKNVSYESYKNVNFHWLRQLASKAMHFEPKFEVRSQDVAMQGKGTSIGALDKEWVAFLENYPMERGDKSKVRSRGLEYLAKGVEGSD
ncbi:MAG: DNA repair exonuclease [Methanomassiliicoccales archaeon]|nr:DNA repair exonuclease [Methanomassiliicoccales archaeon]